MLTLGPEEEEEEEEVTKRVTSSVYEKTCRQYCVKKRLIFVILFSLSVRMMDAVIRI